MSTSCALREARRLPAAAPDGVGRGVTDARFAGGGGGGFIVGARFAGGALRRASSAAADGVSTALTAPTDCRRAPCWLACRLAPPRRPRLWRFVRCELLED
eukprot:5784237-Lingulodinium_polyedra.AAC.1